MNTTEVKTQLHNYIEKADQAFLRIAYVMFQQYFEEQKNQENREEVLLKKINQGLSLEEKSRLDILHTKRAANTISEEEHTELLQLVEKVEAFTANRVLYLSELAQLRDTDIRSLMKDLQLQKPSHYFRYRKLLAKSKATEVEIDALSDEINSGIAARHVQNKQV